MMVRSVAASAPMIICVLCPAGAKRGPTLPRGVIFLASRASSSFSRSRPMVRRMARTSFSGASVAMLASSGTSMLMLSRSAYLPASVISASSASGIVLRWM